MKVYFDTEFTGLHRNTTLISIGLIAEDGRTFYAECSDYKKSQVDEWVQKNVIDNLKFEEPKKGEDEYYVKTPTEIEDSKYNGYNVEMRGTQETIGLELRAWFNEFEIVELMSDGAIPHDWWMYQKLMNKDYPENTLYYPISMALCVQMTYGDEQEKAMACCYPYYVRNHNALEDAKAIKKVYERALKER